MNEVATATVQGEPFTKWPKDLYIPPDALEVLLDTFQGPLDLLLYLIKQQNLDILNIPIAEVTRQYLEYIHLMKALRFELAAEYLVMAAMLAEIKSRMLLPRQVNEPDEGDESDLRAQLISKLQAYEQIKQAATDLDAMPQQGIDVFWAIAECHATQWCKTEPEVDLTALLSAFGQVLKRASLSTRHVIAKEVLSVRERMSQILVGLETQSQRYFADFFSSTEGRMGLVVTFVAILELVKQSLIELVQPQLLGALAIKLS